MDFEQQAHSEQQFTRRTLVQKKQRVGSNPTPIPPNSILSQSEPGTAWCSPSFSTLSSPSSRSSGGLVPLYASARAKHRQQHHHQQTQDEEAQQPSFDTPASDHLSSSPQQGLCFPTLFPSPIAPSSSTSSIPIHRYSPSLENPTERIFRSSSSSSSEIPAPSPSLSSFPPCSKNQIIEGACYFIRCEKGGEEKGGKTTPPPEEDRRAGGGRGKEKRRGRWKRDSFVGIRRAKTDTWQNETKKQKKTRLDCTQYPRICYLLQVENHILARSILTTIRGTNYYSSLSSVIVCLHGRPDLLFLACLEEEIVHASGLSVLMREQSEAVAVWKSLTGKMTLPKLTKKFVDFSAKFSFDKVEGALLEEGEGENGGKEIREKLRKCTRELLENGAKLLPDFICVFCYICSQAVEKHFSSSDPLLPPPSPSSIPPPLSPSPSPSLPPPPSPQLSSPPMSPCSIPLPISPLLPSPPAPSLSKTSRLSLPPRLSSPLLSPLPSPKSSVPRRAPPSLSLSPSCSPLQSPLQSPSSPLPRPRPRSTTRPPSSLPPPFPSPTLPPSLPLPAPLPSPTHLQSHTSPLPRRDVPPPPSPSPSPSLSSPPSPHSTNFSEWAVGALLFLRIVVPALLNPSSPPPPPSPSFSPLYSPSLRGRTRTASPSSLCSSPSLLSSPSPLQKSKNRTMTIVGKYLMRLACHTFFPSVGKDKLRCPINQILTEFRTSFTKFCEEVVGRGEQIMKKGTGGEVGVEGVGRGWEGEFEGLMREGGKVGEVMKGKGVAAGRVLVEELRKELGGAGEEGWKG